MHDIYFVQRSKPHVSATFIYYYTEKEFIFLYIIDIVLYIKTILTESTKSMWNGIFVCIHFRLYTFR